MKNQVIETANSVTSSRREFLVGASAVGLGASMGSMLWSSSALAGTPKRGGDLVTGLSGSSTSDTLDPAKYNNNVVICLTRACRDNLVELGQDNEAKPALAESWDSSDDAVTWNFKLRKGVEFASGKSLTGNDVVDSINLHRGEESGSGAKAIFDQIADTKVDGDSVTFTLKGANADFPILLTDYHANILPSIDGKIDYSSGDGTGVYEFVSFEPGVSAKLKRAPNAWQSDSFGFFETVEILAINDPNVRQTALLTGDVSVIDRPDLKTVRLLGTKPGIDIVDVPSNFFYAMPMRVDREPFSNVDFRRAIKYAINRQAFVDKIAFGFGTPGNDQPIGPGFNYHAPDIPEFTLDLDKAKHHLKKSGFEGASIEFSAADSAFTGAVDAGILMREDLAAIGIDLNVVREPNDGYWSDVWNKKPFVANYWGARPIEDMILSINFLTDSPWNDTAWGNERVDELVAAARGELDSAKRAAMYREVQMLISQDGATLVPAYGRDVAAKSSSIGTTGQYGGGWELDGGHFIKRWWHAG